MKRHLLGLLVLLAPLAASAQTGNGFDLTWNTMDAGGVTGNLQSGGGFILEGTIGQADAGFLSSRDYALHGGFWGGGQPITVSAPPTGETIPLAFRVYPAIPNPFRSSLRLGIDLPADAPLLVELFGARGERVRTLASGPHTRGRYFFDWDGRNDAGMPMSGGIYFLRIHAGAHRVLQKIGYLR